MPHLYAANYCEENVWHLAGDAELPPGERHVVLVASLGSVVPLWCQRAATSEGEVVLWDYHVFLAVCGEARWIYDLDSTLPFPCPLERYLSETFGPAEHVPPPLQPRFRVVAAETYRRALCSDRAHMRRQGGGWLSPPPAWDPPAGEPPLLPLASAIDMRDTAALGALHDLASLRRALGA